MPSNLFQILIFISIINFIISDDYEVTKLPGVRFSTENEIESFLNKTDLTCLAFYYKKESDKSNEIAKNLKSIYSKLKYLAEYILIDCDKSNLDNCKQSTNEKEFFYLEVYIPPELKYNPYTQKMNKHTKFQYKKSDIEEKALYNFLKAAIVSKEQIVNNENYENFISKRSMNKVILFTDKQKTPLMFKGLSGYFYDRLLFGIVKNTEKKLCEKLNIKNFPTLMIIQTLENEDTIMDEPIFKIYDGKLETENIVKYLEKYALKEKLYISFNKNNNKEESKYQIYFTKLKAEKTMEFFEKKYKNNVILYFDNKVENGKITYNNLSKDIKEFNTQTHGFFNFGYVDCTGEKNEKSCYENFKIKEYPSMYLYKPEKNTKERISKSIELPMEKNDINREINSLYEIKATSSNRYNFNEIIADDLQKGKIIALYLFDTYIDLGFNLITQNKNYKEKIDFVIMDNPIKEIRDYLKVNKLPYLAFLTLNSDAELKNGKPGTNLMDFNIPITYSNLKAVITESFKFPDDNKNSETYNDFSNEKLEIIFINTTNDLINTCSKKKLCVIGFFDLKENENSKKNFNKNFEIYKNFAEKNKKRPTTFGYINATCQEEFTSKFGISIESLPSIIIYSYNKDVYANLVGSFNVEDMTELVSKTVSGRINFQRMQKSNAELQNIKCEDVQNVVIKDDDDDEIMKELLAEEQKKREEFDKMRGKEETKKKKKKKDKKKKKNTDL